MKTLSGPLPACVRISAGSFGAAAANPLNADHTPVQIAVVNKAGFNMFGNGVESGENSEKNGVLKKHLHLPSSEFIHRR